VLLPFFCTTSRQVKHSTHPGHGNSTCPTHICPSRFDYTPLMFQNTLPVPPPWSIQGWEAVNYIFLPFLRCSIWDTSVNVLRYREKWELISMTLWAMKIMANLFAMECQAYFKRESYWCQTKCLLKLNLALWI